LFYSLEDIKSFIRIIFIDNVLFIRSVSLEIPGFFIYIYYFQIDFQTTSDVNKSSGNNNFNNIIVDVLALN